MLSIRSSLLLALLVTLLGLSALAVAPASGPQRAVAADETGEETTTPPEEPPVIETPTEPETTPEPEPPANPTPPVTTPVGGPSGGEGGGAPVETPKSTPSTGSEATAGGGGGGAGGGGSGGGGSSSGSSGSAATGTTTSTPATTPSRHTRAPRHATGGGSTSGGGGAKAGTGLSGGGGDSGGGGHRAPSSSGGGGSLQPTVSPQAINEGASTVSTVASHVGEVFAEALPTAPLKKIGDRLAAHIAGADSARGGKAQKQAADHIRTALGAALIGSAVAVDRQPAPSSSPISFIDPSSGESGTVYLILIAALLLVAGFFVLREVRKSLGFGTPGGRAPVSRPRSRTASVRQAGAARFEASGIGDRWTWRFRRLRASAAAGLRSLF